MKKKSLLICGLSLIIGATATIISSIKNNKLSDIAKANIEALASAPQMIGPGGSNSGTCYSEYRLDGNYRVLRCGDCTFATGRGTRVGGTCGQ